MPTAAIAEPSGLPERRVTKNTALSVGFAHCVLLMAMDLLCFLYRNFVQSCSSKLLVKIFPCESFVCEYSVCESSVSTPFLDKF